MTRKPVVKIKPQVVGNAKIKPATAMRCEKGHEFGVDLDKMSSFYGRRPSTVRCPYPTCDERVPVKPLEKN